jgi:hypothetical protein
MTPRKDVQNKLSWRFVCQKQYKKMFILLGGEGRNWRSQKPTQRNKFSAFSDRYCWDTVLLDFCIV